MAVKNLLHFIVKIIFSSQQIAVSLIMYGSLFSVLLFYLFFKTFESYYIDELKSIYPTVYIVSNKKIDNKNFKNLTFYPEIFELNWNNFNISFDRENSFSLGDIGIRSFHKNNLPKILNDTYKQGQNIYVSNNIYRLLKTQKEFNSQIYIESDIDNKFYKFNVVEFNLHDKNKWIMIEDKDARKLYRNYNFNKIVFYSQLEDDKFISYLKTKFKQPIFSWNDHISLSSRALKESMIYVFSLLSLAIVILVISSFVFFAQNIFDDLAHITKYAFFYGIGLKTIFLIYYVIVNLYVGIIFALSYFSASYINTLLVEKIWSVDSKNYIDFVSLFIFVELSIIAILWLYTYISEKNIGFRMSRV